jgi:hypothetical protein
MPIIYLHMKLDEFRNSLVDDRPPEKLNLPLAALWWDAKGDWTKAHESAQQDEGPAGAWVHAYLHMRGTGIAAPENLKPAFLWRKSGLRSSKS